MTWATRLIAPITPKSPAMITTIQGPSERPGAAAVLFAGVSTDVLTIACLPAGSEIASFARQDRQSTPGAARPGRAITFAPAWLA
jgi:hypothetical protein